ncbi:hypothetical protein T02_3672 [Trichinella nativa]|uniref:Uncharacterized protein n=1 Tax=Trichinella nativa TaxID=6335 RepID=A0A0V1L2X8_9BILA|nr:hypothetical protein T02_3672 [Trichinella nativa]
MEVNQQEHDRIHDYQVPSHRSQWRSLLQQLLGVEIAHTTTFLDIGHQHQKGGHNHIAIMGGDNCSECFGYSLQAANINLRDLRSLEIAFVQYLKLKYFQIYAGFSNSVNDGCGLLFNL